MRYWINSMVQEVLPGYPLNKIRDAGTIEQRVAITEMELLIYISAKNLETLSHLLKGQKIQRQICERLVVPANTGQHGIGR